MIAYDLKCKKGHTFEGWFESADAYDDQQERKLVSCPTCGSSKVVRAPSVFGIAKHSGKDYKELQENPVQFIKEFVEDNFEDVGAEFSKEALKMHYNVSEKRNIRGVSTEKEDETLVDEGIPFFKLPIIDGPTPEDDD